MNDKQRAAFENWAKTHHGIYNIGSVNGVYSNPQVSHDWFLWQKAIASAVVDIKNLPSASYTSSGVVYLSDVADDIEKAGVKHNDE